MSLDPLTSKPFVIIKELDGDQKKVVLSGVNSWTIGRGDDNTIVIRNDTSVSRHHAMLQYMDSNSIYLIDLGSTNGSFVSEAHVQNERRINIPTLLQDGDYLRIGQTEIEFHHEASPPPESPGDQSNRDSNSTRVLQIKRLISVAVVDIRGYTALTQQTDVRLLAQVMSSWFRQGGDIVRRHSCQAEKFIGDAIMAVWLHNQDPNGTKPPDVLRAFRAVLTLYDMTGEINAMNLLPEPIRIGAGINTGSAIVGQLGRGASQEFTVIGDTVNAAFRLESATRQLEADIVISDETHMALTAQLSGARSDLAETCFRRTTVDLKGIGTAQIYHCFYEELRRFLKQHAPG